MIARNSGVRFLLSFGEMSWQLISRSFAVLRRNPKLLMFPVLSALAAAAIVALYFFTSIGGGLVRSAAGWHVGRIDVVSLLLTYWLLYFSMIFFNCALAACAQAEFSGTEMSVGGGIAAAMSKIVPILVWSLIASTVGILLRVFNERSGLWGKIVAGALGLAWNVATFLVIPVLIMEDVSAIDAVRRSGQLLRKTWGEQLTVGIGMFWIGLLLALPGVALGALGMNYYSPAIAVAVIYFVALAAVMTAVRRIFDVALYRFATSGQVDGFPPAMLNRAFAPRGR